MSQTDAIASSAMAIVGMAGRFPCARDMHEFWDNLSAGRTGIRRVIPSASSRLPRDPNYVPMAATVEDADCFDAGFFGIYPRQAQEMDPQHRLFLEVCWHALEDAGYRPDATPGSVGVFAGCHMNTYIFLRLAADAQLRGELADSFPGGNLSAEILNDKDYLATRIAFHLNLRGPAVAVQSACSTSLIAIAQACQSLKAGECDMALAGGATITFPQDQGYLHTEDSILSPDGSCRTFDADAKGTVFGDGVGAIVLKRAEDAVRDGDAIYALLRGWGVNNDGGDKGGYTAPSIDGQTQAILRSHQCGGITADTISYVEAHGTGTLVGDPIEVAALTKAFRKTSTRKQYCAIASLKSNVGHLDVAAGVAAVIKTSLALHHQQLPPSLNFERPNPAINFDDSPFYVQTELTDWQADSEMRHPRRAGVSSFGVGGTNGHVVLEEAPKLPERAADSTESRRPELLCLSAPSESALEQMRQDLADYLRSHPTVNLADVSHTLLMGRKPWPFRLSCAATGAEQASTALASARIAIHRGRSTPELAFMFPGQGSQHVGMAHDLYLQERSFRELVDEVADHLQPHTGVDLRTLAFDPAAEADLNDTAYAQPAIFMVSYALAQWYRRHGWQPNLLIGHSVGEFAAAAVAGVMSLADAAMLVAARGRVMQPLPSGSMLALNLAEPEVQGILPAGLEVAAVNAPELLVVSGPTSQVTDFAEAIERGQYGSQLNCRLLHTSHAFHSAMMDPAVVQFREVVQRVDFAVPRLPIWSTVTGQIMSDQQATDAEYWSQQIRLPVQFSLTLANMLDKPELVLLEVGPGQALTSLARQQSLAAERQFVVSSLPHAKQKSSARQAVYQALTRLWQAGVSPDAQAWFGPQRRRLHLPTYPFERQRHWFEVSSPPDDHSSPVGHAAVGEAGARQPAAEAASVPSDRSTASTVIGQRLSSNAAETQKTAEELVRQHMQIMHRQLDLLSRYPK